MFAQINSSAPPAESWTVLQDIVGGLAAYIGRARSVQPASAVELTSVSKEAAALFTTDGNHGLASDNLITIAGATGDWAALNGTHKVTVTGAGTFTIAVNTSAYTGDFDGTVTTTAPRTTASCWSIMKQFFDGDGNATRIANCNGSTKDAYVYDSRATYSYM